jgi:hypothetical protein
MWSAVPDVLVTDLGDELVLLDPASSEMFSLNDTGRLLWQALPAHENDLTTLLEREYDLPHEQAQADVHILLTSLEARHLITRL